MAGKFATTVPDGTPITAATAGTLGHRNDEALTRMFPGSPIHDGIYTPAIVLACGDACLHGGPAATALGAVGLPDGGNVGYVNDGGYMFDSTQSLDYLGDNDVAAAETTGETMDAVAFNAGAGAPATSYIPDLTAGTGGLLPSDLPREQTSYGSGDGGTASPLDTSANIALQTIEGVMGDLGDGSSGAGAS